MAMAGLFSTVLGLIAWMIKRSFDNAQKNLGDTIQTTQEALSKSTRDALSSVREITDSLRQSISSLDSTIKSEQKERIQNQKDIAGMERDIKSNTTSIERVEKKVDRHIARHNND